MFFGSMVALITPMKNNGEIDEESLRKLVDFHVAAGTKAIIACGTTGEAATLSDAEQLRVIKIVVEQAAGKIAVIAGTGANCTKKATTLTLAAMSEGVDACLIVTPYYIKPTQEGLFQHYKAIANKAAIPLILYNVPGRTGVDLLPETVIKLAKISNVIGIKEATGNIARAQEIHEACGDSLDIYSGDDGTALDLILKAHAKGVISVTANVVPKLMADMCHAALNDAVSDAEMINKKLNPLHKALFLESNPIPVKWALYKQGLAENVIRSPMTPLAEKYRAELEKILIQLELKIN